MDLSNFFSRQSAVPAQAKIPFMARRLIASMAFSTIVLSSGLMAMAAPSQAFKQTSASTLREPLSSQTMLATQAASDTASVEKQVIDQINQYRASRRLPPLKLDPRISEQARVHSQEMASSSVPFGHQGFDQRVQAIARGIPNRGAAENVAYNYSGTANEAVQQWLKSTGHRNNIEGQYNLTGIGVAKNAKGQSYFTQIFIRA